DLAAEPRGLGEAKGKIEHVLFVVGRLDKHVGPLGFDDDVASRASQRAFARTLEIDVVAVCDLQDGKADWRLHFLARAVSLDEHHLGHLGSAPSNCRTGAVHAGLTCSRYALQ